MEEEGDSFNESFKKQPPGQLERAPRDMLVLPQVGKLGDEIHETIEPWVSCFRKVCCYVRARFRAVNLVLPQGECSPLAARR